jgi:hypothetical protein
VTVSVEEPADLETLVDELEAILADEHPFALTVLAPQDIGALQHMLWDAPEARRRLRRRRTALAAWCEAAAHVLTPEAHERVTPATLRYGQLIWGCATIAATSADNAVDMLLARLADRPVPQAV